MKLISKGQCEYGYLIERNGVTVMIYLSSPRYDKDIVVDKLQRVTIGCVGYNNGYIPLSGQQAIVVLKLLGINLVG